MPSRLDIAAKKYKLREEIRKGNVPDLDELTVEEKQMSIPAGENEFSRDGSWNLSADEMAELDRLLQPGSRERFEDDTVASKKDKLRKCNESTEKMISGDISRFSTLPDVLKEYYGRKSLIQFFGSDTEFPPLDELSDEKKQELDRLTVQPEFRHAISLLIERNPVDQFGGRSTANRLTEYDEYINQHLLEETLRPVEGVRRDNILRKYPGEQGEKIIEINAEKQLFTAKTLFMSQLGRMDIRDAEGEARPYEGTSAELIAHGGRTIMTLPQGNGNLQREMMNAWKGRAVEENAVQKRRFATHDMTRRHVDMNGATVKAAVEKKLKFGKTLKAASYFGNYGMNLAVGGMGTRFNKTDAIDDQGSYGHMYIRAKEGTPDRCGAILFGVENSGPQKRSGVGTFHGADGKGHSISGFYASKKTVGKVYGGREVDLSHLHPQQLADALNQFEIGYRDLQNQAKIDPQARQKLERVNSKLSGKKMTARDMARMMIDFGMAKNKALEIVEAGRSCSDAEYGRDSVYSADMNRIPEYIAASIPERQPDKAAVQRWNEISSAAGYVDNLKRMWKVMNDHTGFRAFNSAEYDRMEKAFQAYTKAYENILAGKTVDGKSKRPVEGELSQWEYNKLQTLKNEMKEASKQYHDSKMADNGGRFFGHKSKQGADRDAMSMILADYDNGARKWVKNNPAAETEADGPVRMVDLQQVAMRSTDPNRDARAELNERIQMYRNMDRMAEQQRRQQLRHGQQAENSARR